MLTRMATTETKTADPGAVARPVNYPTTIVAMVTEDTKKAIVAEAKARQVSQGVIARELLELGMDAYGI